MGLLVKHTMKIFFYTFWGVDRRQEDGGPMGDKLTQALSKFIVLEYNEMFLTTLEKLEVKLVLYERCVDDQDVMGWSIGRSLKFCQEAGVMINKSQQEIESEEKDKNEDKIFMAEQIKIANSIIPMLKTEADSTSNHPELNY